MRFQADATLFSAVRAKDDAEPDIDAALARFLFELRARQGIKTDILNAFEAVPRALFMPHIPPHLLYAPIALPLPCGEEAEDPVSLALHLGMLNLAPGHNVLEIGTGSGFSAALMAQLGARVTSVERYRTLLGMAKAALLASGVSGVALLHGDGLALKNAGVVYNRILINGAVETVPAALFKPLVEGGSALGHRRRGAETRLTLWQKDVSGHITESDFGTSRATLLRRGLPETL